LAIRRSTQDRKFSKGTLLVSIAATIAAAGILAFDCCIPDSLVAIQARPGTDTEYLYYYLRYARTELGLAPQSAQKSINLKILSSLDALLLVVLARALGRELYGSLGPVNERYGEGRTRQIAHPPYIGNSPIG
jgi:hypothetical protein